MSKEMKLENIKSSVEEIWKNIIEIKDIVKKYRVEIKERLKKKPLETAAIIFATGMVLGISIAKTKKRRTLNKT